MDFSYTYLILLIPLVVFLLTGLLGGRLKPEISGWLGTTGMLATAIISYVTAYTYFSQSAKTAEGAFDKITASWTFTWLQMTENLHIDIGALIDPITVMMLVVITTVSFLVHLYSIGYMKGDPGFAKFYAYLSLFSFSMLGLVMATNIFQMYIFWELVGLSSFLLIGFYYEKPSAVAASKKAFIVTRFADLGFLVGILLLSSITGTFNFTEMAGSEGILQSQTAGAVFLGLSSLSWALILIFIGGAGKSAMFPLHIWLPDAMEGPTPVSALIHAATMVVAGVYLVARLFPVFGVLDSHVALEIVAAVGAFSSLFAAVIACTQTDIKRVLAYSTMSQIGYMMCAMGVVNLAEGEILGYSASLFHLFTHAFFKALLFLGAGSVIHAVHNNDMGEMGQLRKYLPITHITFLIACIAIAGIPPFAGFFSKDEILVAALEHNLIYFIVEYAVAGLTAFYMFRLYFSVFWGKEKAYDSHHLPHESPITMTLPLILLAIGAMGAGLLPFTDYVTLNGLPLETHFHWQVAVPSVLIALAGIGLAAWLYMKGSDKPDKIAAGFKGFYTAAYHKFYLDEAYLFVTKSIIFKGFAEPIAWFDRNVVDASLDLIASLTNFVSASIKEFQSGQVQQYALVFVTGALALALIFIYLLTF